MCGIIYGESFTDAPINDFIRSQFEEQKHRGQQGFGVFDKECTRLVRNPKEKSILKWIKNHPAKSLLFHHRMPTSTDNVKNACHPFSTQDFFDTNYVLVHNGHISNSRELKPKHEKLGIEYYSMQKDGRFNDSEALLWDVALYLEGKQDKLNAHGGMAFICMAIPKDGRKSSKLYFARNTNPLVMSFTDEALLLSSEGKEGEDIDADTLYMYNYRTKKLQSSELKIPRYEPYVAGSWNSNHSGYRGGMVGSYPNDPYDWESDFNNVTEYDTYEEWLAAKDKRDTERQLLEAKIKDGAGSRREQGEKELAQELLDGATLDGLMALPDNADYSYKSIMEDFDDDLVLEDSDGTMKNVKSIIFDRLDSYLETVDGNYKNAYAMIRADIYALREAIKADEQNGYAPDPDVVFEIDVLICAKYALYTSRYWETEHSIDPWYVNDSQGTIKEGIKTFITRSGQSQLALPNGKKK